MLRNYPVKRNFTKLIFTILVKLSQLLVIPQFRALYFKFFGASIGKNVRIYDINLINLETGFKNLSVSGNVHIGPECLIDLSDKVFIASGTTISPRVCLLTHSDPGSQHNSPICEQYPAHSAILSIGENCWIGTGAIVLCGAEIADNCIIGAGAVVIRKTQPRGLYVGVPARRVKEL